MTTDFDKPGVFRALFGAYPDSLLLVDHAGRIVLASASAATLMGYSPGELIGLAVDTLVPDSIRPRHDAYRRAYAMAPRTRPMGTQMDLVARRKDGSEVMVEIALSPLESDGEEFVVAAIRDISTYPRVAQALQRARYSEHLAKLGRIAVDTPDPNEVLDDVTVIAAEALQVDVARVFVLDAGGERFRVASGVGSVAGEEVGAFVAKGPDTSPGYVLATGRPVIVTDYKSETRFPTPQSYIDAGLSSALGVPISDRGRIVGTLVVRSIVAKRFGDDEIRFLESLANLVAASLQRAENEEAVRHSQRLESVGQLTGGIAHDFNNLLTVIQGNLQVLEDLPLLEGETYAQQLLTSAARATRRGAELTSKLLAFSRRQVLQPAPVDVGALLRSLADMLRRTLDQRVRIHVDAGDEVWALADPGQLEAALLNIAINARDAMPEGGDLRFTARLDPGAPAPGYDHFAASRSTEDGRVMISIADTGGGMSDEVRARAFEPFFTTKDAGRGTGLGLSTVYGFVKQSAGTVTIDSVPGVGTRLNIHLPQSRSRPSGTVTTGTPTAIPAGLRVMLVEDEPEVRSITSTFLEAMRCSVSAAGTAEEAWSMFEQTPEPQLLISDISLGPGMRGTELALLVVQHRPGLPILLMSGFPIDLIDADRDSPPAWELLAKPFTREELASAVGRALANVAPDAS